MADDQQDIRQHTREAGGGGRYVRIIGGVQWEMSPHFNALSSTRRTTPAIVDRATWFNSIYRFYKVV